MSLAAASGTTIHLAQGHYDVASPGSKHVTIVGVGADFDTGSAIVPGQGLAVDVDDPAGVLTLKSLALGADPFGAYVTNGTLNMSHVAISGSRCAIVMTGGRVTLTDSKVVDAGTITDQDCRPLADSPAAVTMNGGTLSLVRSSLTDTKDEPGIVINGGHILGNRLRVHRLDLHPVEQQRDRAERRRRGDDQALCSSRSNRLAAATHRRDHDHHRQHVLRRRYTG